ncbi:NUDIX hydrolase [Sporosarcina sp. Te-1]|uniref:NUDIX hydrolase n=1 Tax=Sporosarcina sp. Te-1 TaxID=2818390 RepID=UPI001A9F0789|nr:NUDIX hydrolase [Sporosarcina sp. Te-1]QTD42378.1 NUDIX hydrolase [Sporosarcina sp. Te-1]
MKSWKGSAGICINDQMEILMVKAFGSEKWAIPSGGIEEGETPEECCVREVKEETGYDIKIMGKLRVKETVIEGIQVKIHYFRVVKIGESSGINDPDDNIAEAEWKSISEMKMISHAYPEDLEFLLEEIKQYILPNDCESNILE